MNNDRRSWHRSRILERNRNIGSVTSRAISRWSWPSCREEAGQLSLHLISMAKRWLLVIHREHYFDWNVTYSLCPSVISLSVGCGLLFIRSVSLTPRHWCKIVGKKLMHRRRFFPFSSVLRHRNAMFGVIERMNNLFVKRNRFFSASSFAN